MNPDRIPRIIHFVWLGSQPPTRVLSNVEGFRRLNPQWEVRLWRDDDLTWLPHTSLAALAPASAGRTAAVSYEVVSRFGGFYFATEFEPIGSLDSPLVPDEGLVTCRESRTLYSDAFFAAPPEHPFLRRLTHSVEVSIAANPEAPARMASGPGFFTNELTAWAGEPGNEFNEIPRDVLFPYGWDKPGRATGPWAASVIAVYQWRDVANGQAAASQPPNAATKPGIQALGKKLRGRARGRALLDKFDRALDQRLWRPQSVDVGEGRAVTVTRHGWPLIFDTSDLDVLGFLYSQGWYEPAYHRFLSEVLQGSDVYVDVGANIGQFVVSAAHHLTARGRVFAFEPNPRAFETLAMNVYLNRNSGRIRSEVVLSNNAVGRRSGTAVLNVPGIHAGRATLGAEVLADVPDAQLDRIEVEVVSLDESLDHLSHVRLLKIDVEGFEADVVEGAAGLITSGRVDYLDIESVRAHQGARLGRMIALLSRLEAQGARFSALGRSGFTALKGPVATSMRARDFGHLLADLTNLRPD